VWRDVGYRPLVDAGRARALFDFAAIPWPEQVAFAWGASMAAPAGERLVGAVAAERHATAVPEVALPPALAGRPGAGLYAWRGGSALWTLREAAG
jgi:hypothetical protein